MDLEATAGSIVGLKGEQNGTTEQKLPSPNPVTCGRAQIALPVRRDIHQCPRTGQRCSAKPPPHERLPRAQSDWSRVQMRLRTDRKLEEYRTGTW